MQGFKLVREFFICINLTVFRSIEYNINSIFLIIFSEKDINSRPMVAKYGQNFTSLIARYCYGRIPRSCDRGMLNESRARPCTLGESFVSSGGFVTLELKNTETTVLR